MSEAEREVVNAVLYAMREGCFFPVPEPQASAPMREWIQWGAMRNLHNKVAQLPKPAMTPSVSADRKEQ
jgi:hypothetical protein